MKKRVPIEKIAAQCKTAVDPAPFIDSVFLPNQCAIIAEMKKASPSAGEIVKKYDPEKLGLAYRNCGARAISVLTESEYFKGSPEHLVQAREASGLPILRKDFIIDAYQIYESKILGASAILLIVAILDKKNYSELIRLARQLKLEALVEIHSESELELALPEEPRLIGINNRNLKDLSVNIDTTFELFKKAPKNATVIAESGIQSTETIRQLKSAGIRGALIGESILKSKNMEEQLKSFVEAGK